MNTPHDTSHEALIRDLADDLAPRRPLPAPAWRTLGWLGVVAVIALCGAWFADLPALGRRLSAAPDMWLAVAGSVLTMLMAAFATFELSLPDRSRLWALLPLPAAIIWIAGSGVGCLRTWLIPGTHAAEISEERDCLLIIIGLSIPLMALLLIMIRKACTLEPGMAATMAGLASAAAAATLLILFHPYDATASDLLIHAVAVTIVLAASYLFGGRTLKINSRPT
ncbi:MAG: NrsF family protein [Xanthobacteraceae bacterium]